MGNDELAEGVEKLVEGHGNGVADEVGLVLEESKGSLEELVRQPS